MIRKQWNTGYENNGTQDTKTMEYKIREQWNTRYENNGTQDTRAMGYRTHEQNRMNE